LTLFRANLFDNLMLQIFLPGMNRKVAPHFYLLLGGVLLLPYCASGQAKSAVATGSARPLGYDTTYIANYHDKLSVTLVGSTKTLDMAVANPDNPKQALEYKPTTAYNWGIGLDYKWLSLELTTKLPFVAYYGPHRGNSRQLGLRFNSTGRKVWFTSFIQYYAGHYLSNPELLEPNWLKQYAYYPARPDIANLALYVGANYAFNHRRYSQNAAVSQLEQQKKSAGTFVLGGAMLGFATTADSSVVPGALMGQFPPQTHLTGSATVGLALNFGYVHTFVLKQKFFIHLGLIPGFTAQASAVTLADATEKTYPSTLSGIAEARLSVGYNGKTYYGGIHLASLAFADNTGEGRSMLTYSYSNVRLFFGRRFTLPFHLPIIDRKVRNKE
jgi:hypothetical protein